ncbi:MAG: hypothetical protein AAFR21_02640 [Pseudomonadota bacterium]
MSSHSVESAASVAGKGRRYVGPTTERDDPAFRGLSPAKRKRLDAFLEVLPLRSAERLFTAIDQDRAQGMQSGLPHEALLASLRPLISDAGGAFPARAQSALRILIEPVEDFLIVSRRGRKRPGRIARTSLTPIWRLIENDPATEEAARLADDLEARIKSMGASAALDPEIDSLTTAFRERVARGLATIVQHCQESEGYRADIIRRLSGGRGETGAFEDMAELAQLLPLASEITLLKERLARPLVSLTEEEIFEVRRSYAKAFQANPDTACYILLFVAARIDRPWRGLRLYYHLLNARDQSLPQMAADAQGVSEFLFGDLEGLARMLEKDAEGPFDANDAKIRLRMFSDFASGMAEEAEQASDGVFSNRVEASRDIAASALERFCEQALAAIRYAQPTRHAGGSSRLRALRPDINRPHDLSIADAAHQAAQFLSDAASIAQSLKRPGVADPMVSRSVVQTRQYAGDVVREIRAAEGDERKRARELMDQILDLSRFFLPETEIALLREKAAAAFVSA